MSERIVLPAQGSDWPALRARLEAAKSQDVDWRNGRAALYVHFAGDEVLRVAKEAHALYFSENALGAGSAFPSLRRLEADIVAMTLSLLNAPESARGNVTSGGSESIFLAVKAARDWARAVRPEAKTPTILLPRTAHPAFDKAAHYLGLRAQRVAVNPTTFRADHEAMGAAIDSDTIMIVGSAPAFPHGVVDPIEEIAALAVRHNLWCHVDACVGGFSLPFVRRLGHPVPMFDFSVSGVTSISADLHKYGFTAKGASTISYVDAEHQAYQAYDFTDWPRGRYFTHNFGGTRPGGPIAAAWAVMNHLGEAGYLEVTRKILAAREGIRAGIAPAGLTIWGEPEMGVFAYGSPDHDMGRIGQGLTAEGWLVGCLQEPKGIHLMLTLAHAPAVEAYVDAVLRAARSTQHLDAPSADMARYG